MGFYRGPSIVRDGLVLYLDAANPKSLDTRNLLYNTDSLTGWSKAPYNGVMSITPNFTLAPDGTFTASKFQFTQGLAYRCIMRNALLKLGETHTFSVYAKAVSGTATFSLDIGDQGNKSFTVNDTEWVRCSITHTRTSQYSETTNFADITANLGTEVYLWGAQLNYGGLIDYVPVGNTSIPFRNLTGSENNGTLTNGPTFDSANGGSIVFDGVNDFVNLPTSTSLWSSNFSINFFTKSNILGNQFIFSNGSYGTAATNIWFGGGSLNNFTIHLRRTDGTGAIGYNFTLPLPYNLLTYYSIVYNTNDNTLKLYQNSNLVESKNTSLVDPSWMPNGWRIGNSNGWTSINGNIYNFTIYNRALTAEEILQNYNATKSRFGL